MAHQENRLSWNEATAQHHLHKPELLDQFRENPGELFAEDREILGNVEGLRVAHMQCNDGQDTLRLARLGAHVTGISLEYSRAR